MNKLREILEAKPKILVEKTKDGSMTILAPWIVTGRLNKNRRLYPLALIQREVARLQPSIKAGAMISSADHPSAPHTSLANASHIITKLELDQDGKGWMEARVLPTAKGKNVMTIIKAGGQLGISARGVGDVRADGTIENNYQLLGCDIVTNPAEPEAVFDKANICESVEFEEENEDPDLDKTDIAKELKRRAELEEALSDLLHTSFLKAQESDCWYGDFESYKAQYEKGMREVMGLADPSGDIKQAEKKLSEEQIQRRIWSHFDEAKKAGFIGTFEAWKQAYPKIVEQAGKSIKISEEMAQEPEKPFVGDVRFYFNEARKAGFTGTIEKFKEQYPERVAPDYEEKIAEEAKRKKPETLEEEAQRIFEGLKKDNPNSSVTLESVKRMLEKEEVAKSDKRLRKRAIAIVSNDVFAAGGGVSQAQLEKMVAAEIENLKRQRAEMRERNWQAYEKLLDE